MMKRFTIEPKNNILGRPDRFIQLCVKNGDLVIVNAKTRKDISCKFNIQVNNEH